MKKNIGYFVFVLAVLIATALIWQELRIQKQTTRFLAAISQIESGGRYNARNDGTDAYGKYQLVPPAWRYWSIRCLGYVAEQTPKNQERVARFKARTLYRQYGRWRDVASMWFSGQPYSHWPDPKSIGEVINLEDYCNTVLKNAGGLE